jgi:hypothetical protein
MIKERCSAFPAWSSVVLVALLCTLPLASESLPKERLVPLSLAASWDEATSVVSGELRGLHLMTVQDVSQLPPPASANVKRLYWCVGLLEPHVVLKGRLPDRSKPYLWATATPGCQMSALEPLPAPATRIWFIREEDGWTRPVVDAFGVYWTWLHVNEQILRAQDPARQFARLLLDPDLSAANLESFNNTFRPSAELACSILGKDTCTREILGLTRAADPHTRTVACRYLTMELQTPCPGETPGDRGRKN